MNSINSIGLNGFPPDEAQVKRSTQWGRMGRERKRMGIVEPRHQQQIYFCFICNGTGGTKHHLVPKAVMVKRGTLANRVVRCCRPCHDDIHYFFSHWELAYKFNEPEALKAELLNRKQQAVDAT